MPRFRSSDPELEPRLAPAASLVADINPTMHTAGSAPAHFLQVGDRVFFTANIPGLGRELWQTDGTSTSLVRDIVPGSAGPSWLVNFTNVNNTLYFTTHFSSNSKELWKSDGTSEGTVLVRSF